MELVKKLGKIYVKRNLRIGKIKKPDAQCAHPVRGWDQFLFARLRL